MNHFRSIILCCLSVFSTFLHADTIAEVDSLLNVYANSSYSRRTAVGRELLDIYKGSSVFFDDVPAIADGMGGDEQDLTVWFGTGRFYTTNAYYAEALDYIARALAIIEMDESASMSDTHLPSSLPSLHATLLCDKAYCLFKRSDYTRSIEVGQEAIRLCQQTGNLMQLSRAYLYISLVNHALRKYDEAKVLVVKAIETNQQLGLNVQTHNALGIACEIFCSAMEVDKAIDYGRQAVEAARAIGYLPGVANHLTQLSYAYDRKGDYALGLLVADSAIAMVRATDPLDRNQLALCLEYKSWNLIDIGRQREAAEVLRQAISLQQELGNTHAAWYDYRTLSEALEAFDPHGSIETLKRYTRMGDSIHSEQLKELMSQANAEFHNDELKEANAESRRMNRIIVWTAVIVVLLLAAVIASLLFAFRQKKRTAAALQKLTAAREEFFTNVTHEFRTPLTVILGLADEMGNETGESIKRQGQRLLMLVNQMLDISKVKSELAQPAPTQGSLSGYVQMIVENHRELARQKNVSVTFDTDESGIDALYVADYVEKVVGNLLSNAVKFTPEGGSVSVSLHKVGDGLQLTVADNGPGIEAKDLPHIFEPFYRADTAEAEGTGVGLTLVKQVVDAMGGTVKVESTVGKGTTFRVEMPHTQWSQPLQSVQPPQSSSSISILIVEDNADVASLIGQQLSKGWNGTRPYTLHHAANGDEGLAKARELMPDLVVTDLMMPHTDGLQLCRAIRADQTTNHIPIVVVTAKATERDRIEGLKAGADAYLVKPFNAEELRVRVEKLLEQRQMLREKFAEKAPVTPPVVEQPEEASPSSFVDNSNEFIQKFTEAIDTLMEKGECDVETVASLLCMSTSTLRRKVNTLVGMSPRDYILKLRLEKARAMLAEDPSLTVSYVAEKCGFYDVSHFVKMFRNQYGQNPTAETRS